MKIDRNEKKKTTLFVSDYPMLKAEWDYEQNQPLIPEQVPHKSNQKVNWICPRGHRWSTKISNRANGSGCPFCAGRLPIPGETDLATVFPDIAEQWDYENNAGKTPQDVCAHTTQYANWICPRGHRWSAMINDRSKGSGCPFCAGRLPIPGETDLATVFPYIAEQWDYENNEGKTPRDVCAHSNQHANWICPRGHRWSTRINDRSKGSGCPFCAGRLPIPGETDLATVFPDIAEQWDYENNEGRTPRDVCAYTTTQYANWICPRGHRWSAKIHHRANGSGCPYCSGKKERASVMTDNVDKPTLASAFPLIAREWSKLNSKTPDQVAPHSNQYAYWECKKGHVWEAKINNRVNGTACPFCAGKKPIEGETDLKTLFPKVATLWHPFLNEFPPEKYRPYSNEKVFWLCPVCGMEWRTAIYHLVEGTSCPYCSGRRPIPGKTDFKTVYPDAAALWDYKRNGADKPEQYTPKAHHRAFWLCSKGHSWAAPINRMARAYESARPGTDLGTLGCPVCSGKKVIPGVNDLVTTAPELAAQWDYEKNGDLLPSQVTLHRNRPVFWRCEKGHVWPASPNNRARGTGCPFCNSNRLIPEETSLLVKYSELAKEWDEEKNFPLTAKDVPAFSNDKYWWRCQKGHSWKATVSNRANGRGCPFCSGRLPIPGVSSLDVRYPKIAAEWHPTKNKKHPSEVSPQSVQKAWWICSNGHEWPAEICDRVNGSKCPYCRGKKQKKKNLI